ncbi:MAG: hypothetical protein ACK6CE_02120, partial [Planctomycetota bacterium]
MRGKESGAPAQPHLSHDAIASLAESLNWVELLESSRQTVVRFWRQVRRQVESVGMNSDLTGG